MTSGQAKPERPDYDQAIKRLLTRAHDGFLALIAPGLTWQGERSPELPAIARRADLVWEVKRPNGERGILHVELQTKVEADIGERLAEYAIRLWRRDHLPIRSVVVFLREAPTVPASPFVIPWAADESLRYAFDIIRLWEVPQQAVLGTTYYALWPLASLMAQVTVESTREVAERIGQMPLAQEERGELVSLLILLADTRLPHTAIQDALRGNQMIEDLLNGSSIAQSLREEGEQRGEQRVVQLVLEGRFGPLSDDLLAALRTVDEATLHALAAHVATDSLAELRARLGLA